jgi:hypothetical protein
MNSLPSIAATRQPLEAGEVLEVEFGGLLRKPKFGPGPLDVVGLVQWWRVRSGIRGKRSVVGDGKPFQSLIVGLIVIVISGRLIVWFFVGTRIGALGRGRDNSRILSDGTTLFDRNLPVMFVRIYLFPSRFIGTIW